MGRRGLALLAILMGISAYTQPSCAETKAVFLGDNLWGWGENRIFLIVCNDDSTNMKIESVTDGYFDASMDTAVPPQQCRTGLFHTRNDIVLFKLEHGSKVDSISLTVPEGRSLNNSPWAYILFLLFGYLASVLGGPIRNILQYPFKLLRLILIYRRHRTGLLSHLDSPSRSYAMDKRLIEIADGTSETFDWMPTTMRIRIEKLCEAHEYWKKQTVLRPAGRAVVLRMLGEETRSFSQVGDG